MFKFSVIYIMNESRVKVWEKWEIDFLKNNYCTKGALFCAENLNHRTLESIRIKANRLKLKRSLETRYNQIDAPQGYTYCSCCQQILADSYFYRKESNNSYGKKKHDTCRSCSQEKSRRAYRTHKSSYQERYKKNPAKKLYQNIKTRSKKNNVPFNIDLEDIVIPKICPVLGIEIIPFDNSDHSPSIDKLIPELGYTKGNINVISKRANMIKSNATLEELKMIYLWMEKNKK